MHSNKPDAITQRGPILVTLTLTSYNQEAFVREAVRGALCQTYQPLEIVISDDCSSDNTFEAILDELAGYCGPHCVVLNRNKKNLGTGGHFNRLAALAHGELIVASAADDISLPHRVATIVERYREIGTPYDVIFSNVEVIDKEGKSTGAAAPKPLPEMLEILDLEGLENIGAYGCSQAFGRALFAQLGDLQPGVVLEDRVIPMRAALLGKISYIDRSLVRYRRHDRNIWKAEGDYARYSDYRNQQKMLLKDAVARWQTIFHDIQRIKSAALPSRLTPRLEAALVLQLAYTRLTADGLLSTSLIGRIRSLLKTLALPITMRRMVRFVETVFFLRMRYFRTIFLKRDFPLPLPSIARSWATRAGKLIPSSVHRLAPK